MTSPAKRSLNKSTKGLVIVRPATDEDVRSMELFKDVGEFWLHHMAENSNICSMKANMRLICERAEVSYLYVILKGYVAIWRPSCFVANEYSFLAWRGPSQSIGEMRALGAQHMNAHIYTCDPCDFLEVRTDSFSEALKSEPVVYRNLAMQLLRKMRYQGHRSEVIQIDSATRKVTQTLMHLAEDRLGPELSSLPEIQIPGRIHQDHIAAYAGIARETVNKELANLRKAKIISCVGTKQGSTIVILNRKRLVEISGKTC